MAWVGTTGPKLGKVTRRNGVAGQFSYTVMVTYPNEAPSTVTFVGNAYGGPIVMVTPAMPGGMFVTRPERFGSKLTPSWVRAFFAACSTGEED